LLSTQQKRIAYHGLLTEDGHRKKAFFEWEKLSKIALPPKGNNFTI